MYLEYYGLKEMPFSLTPDPKFFFRTDAHLETLSHLKFGIESKKGLMVLTGESGIGKTTMMRSIIQQFDGSVAVAYLFNPFLTVGDFFQLIMQGLGVTEGRGGSKSDILSALGRFLVWRRSQKLWTVLILDEAHGLPPSVLEEVRLLLNFETDSEKLLQIILCGHPELHEMLRLPALRQVKQRVSLRLSVRPLNSNELEKYIRFRLKVAGAQRVNLFDPMAISLIWKLSRGIPRIVNNICDNALLFGYTDKREAITRDLIIEVADMLDLYVQQERVPTF